MLFKYIGKLIKENNTYGAFSIVIIIEMIVFLSIIYLYILIDRLILMVI